MTTELTALEKAIAAAIPEDPRVNEDALKETRARYGGSQEKAEQKVAKAEDVDDLVSAYMEEEESPAVEEATAAEEAHTENPSANENTVNSFASLENLLASNGTSIDAALTMILGNIKPSPKLNRELWEADVRSTGFEISDIMSAIQEFISKGNVTKVYQIPDARISITYSSRKASHSDWVSSFVAAKAAQSPAWSKDMEQRLELRARLAASLKMYSGPSGKLDLQQGKAKDLPLEKVFDIIGDLEALEFSIMAEKLAEFENLLYLASQKMSIENF